MAWKRIVEWTRPNDSVDFDKMAGGLVRYIYDNYDTSNKIKSLVVSYSDDDLIKTVEMSL